MRRWFLAVASLLGLVLAAPPGAFAEPPAPLRVFMDCEVCDFEFLRQEMGYVDWVRDRRDADVYVLVTTRGTGAGGIETLMFVSRPAGGGPAADTLRIETPPGITADERRRGLMRGVQAIVARDLAGRPEFDRMSLVVRGAPRRGAPERDPWRGWVLSVSANGYLQGQQFSRSSNLLGDFSANRVTAASKMSISGYGSYYEDRYTFGDGSEFTSIRRGHGGSLRAVNTLSPHWGLGARGFYSSSSFSNVDLEVGGGPAIEFDVWPYRESSRRLLTVAYEATGRWVEYEEVTLYDHTTERLWRHAVIVKLSGTQPWGSVSFTGEASQYLRLDEKYRLTASSNLSFNLARGFSLNLSGYAAHLRDLVYLRRSGATDEEVLARQRQIATSYDFIVSAGVSYTFGSIYNSVVNPRLNAVYGRF